jgi:tetratricopeptide (TPR) repeat protein
MMATTEETTAEEEEVAAATTDVMCCASCGIPAVDDVKLKKCACDLAKYCSDECQNNHREQHEEECKKRMAERRDRDLFAMPDGRHLGDCPICCLPLPIDPKKSGLTGCCSNIICKGCSYANTEREIEAGLQHRCAFCREPVPETKEEFDEYRMERIKKNDPVAMWQMGKQLYREEKYEMSLEYLTNAAELGNADAHFHLSLMYRDAKGVEKDDKKEVYHLEEAAIGGHPGARHNLGYDEWNNGNFERARKHWIIAASLGNQDSPNCLRHLYAEGHATKEDYADALRAYQAAVEATKSAERKKGEAYYEATDTANHLLRERKTKS